ncbi:RagB/SusD family nutrient uptake outer membrane protein [Pinibacter soli]|uniref:RagB/SusD family nutrient uptake outer membrane protein n=1 Tax=Pinibacter soli TaxID=3044211 RepID=A0ABT6RG73_9BACT|nr:RagB/SusD family nutrient uptake outer membrane protein [Pinibacter soli]MDI3321375.1 RagB/SusD family nutrient uptake outer membrane protein [Pinibacter soli]
MKTYLILLLITLIIIGVGCKKFVTIDPPGDQIVNPKPFTDDGTATSTITGIYSEMMNNPQQFSCAYTTLLAGMYADELYYYTPGNFDEFTTCNISEVNHGLIESAFWLPAYKYIYAANLALEQLNATTTLSSSVKRRLTGEALFIRVFCYQYLAGLFGDVPLVLGSDYRQSISLPRTSREDVYAQMNKDIAKAVDLLPANFPESDRVRPNKWAAKALQARIALVSKDYATASAAAGEVINNSLFVLETTVNNTFLKDSKEAIWQLQPVRPTYNTTEGNLILPANNNTQPTFVVSSYLLNAFEAGDQRKTAWIGQRVYNGNTIFYPYKYKIRTNQTVTENYVVLRLAEMYLVRAEANARLGQMQDALKDLNIIRKRAGLSNATANDTQSVLQAIEQEKRIELCFEWGMRWFDLQRTGRAAAVLSPIKPGWSQHDTLWPIPIYQLNLNPFLTQNQGY